MLLIRRGRPPKRDQWSLPGGAQKIGESVFEAARREVREETGIECDITGYVDVAEFIDRDAAGRWRYHYTLIDVAGRWRAGEPAPAGDAAEAAWVALDDLEGLDLWDETLRVIRKAAGGGKLGDHGEEAAGTIDR